MRVEFINPRLIGRPRTARRFELMATKNGPVAYATYTDFDRGGDWIVYSTRKEGKFHKKRLSELTVTETPAAHMLPMSDTSVVLSDACGYSGQNRSHFLYPPSGKWRLCDNRADLFVDDWSESIMSREIIPPMPVEKNLIWHEGEDAPRQVTTWAYQMPDSTYAGLRFINPTVDLRPRTPFIAGNTPFGYWWIRDEVLYYRGKRNGPQIRAAGNLPQVTWPTPPGYPNREEEWSMRWQVGPVLLTTNLNQDGDYDGDCLPNTRWFNNAGIGVSDRKIVVVSLSTLDPTPTPEKMTVSIFDIRNGRVEIANTMMIDVPKMGGERDDVSWRTIVVGISEDNLTCWIGIGRISEGMTTYSVIYLDLE